MIVLQISNWDFCEDSSPACSTRTGGKYLDLTMKIKSKDSPSEVDDEECKEKGDDDDEEDQNDNDDDDDDDDDDCPILYNLGGTSEMVLNRGVRRLNIHLLIPVLQGHLR